MEVTGGSWAVRSSELSICPNSCSSDHFDVLESHSVKQPSQCCYELYNHYTENYAGNINNKTHNKHTHNKRVNNSNNRAEMRSKWGLDKLYNKMSIKMSLHEWQIVHRYNKIDIYLFNLIYAVHMV